MSRYTTQLRFLIDLVGENEVKSWFTDYELTDYLTQDEIDVINKRGTWNKDKLAQKIINHYYTKEIGYETPALFKHYVKERTLEIMEEYLPLIYSAAIEYDPLVNVDFTETFNQSDSGSTSGSGIAIDSDTPQGNINKTDILAGNYATSTQGSESTSSSSNTSAYTRHTKGNSGVSATAQKMVQLYRDNIRAIDREIIDKYADLFMGIF